VKRVIARQEAGGAAPERARRGRNYDGVADLVVARVKATSGRISAKRLLPAARGAGYAGSARNFRRLVAEAGRAWRAEHHRGCRPAVWSPGEHLVPMTPRKHHGPFGINDLDLGWGLPWVRRLAWGLGCASSTAKS
jgi:hypothetical protein